MHLLRIFLIISVFALLSLSCSQEVTMDPAIPSGSTDISLIQDVIDGVPVVIAGSEGRNMIVSYERTLDGKELSFTPLQQKLPLLLRDQNGTEWDIFGRGISGPLTGRQLTPTASYMGYWFAWASFYPGAEIYGVADRPANYQPASPTAGWAVTTDEVYVATGKDAIAALQDPGILTFKERDYIDEPYYLKNKDIVVGIRIGNEIRAYPHAILDWHEIVNDKVDGQALAIVYCPFTGTAMAWDRVLNGIETTFGVSGLLYNNNIIPYDRATGDYWSQMRQDCIHGSQLGDQIQAFPIIETSWLTWKDMFPVSEILSENTGHDRDYAHYPYGDYRTDHEAISFPLNYDDPRLPRKERVHGVVVNGKAKVYRFSSF